MSRDWTVSAARAALPEIIRQVEAGDEVRLTRHDRVVAVVVSPETLRVRRGCPTLADAQALRDRLAAAAGWVGPPAAIDPTRADQLAAGVRADRDA